MKDNAQMNHGGVLKKDMLGVWAQYYVRFIQALQKEGIHPWGVSVQNEPAAKQVWDSCLYSAEEERDFIKFHLGPLLKKHFGNEIKLLVWDHNRDIMVERVQPIYQDSLASSFVWGTAFHWYGEEVFANVGKTKALFPDKHLLFTEGCIEGGPRPGSWDTGERYARNIIGDFLQGNEGFIDWNLVLNEQGGPNHVGNYCDAPILFDRRQQTVIKIVVIMPSVIFLNLSFLNPFVSGMKRSYDLEFKRLLINVPTNKSLWSSSTQINNRLMSHYPQIKLGKSFIYLDVRLLLH